MVSEDSADSVIGGDMYQRIRKTHTGIVVVQTALGKVRKTVKLYQTNKAWVVSAGESYSLDCGSRIIGSPRAGILLLDSIKPL